MRLNFDKGRIHDLLLILPEQSIDFMDEMSRYKAPIARSMKLKEVMGYGSHRIVNNETTSSDLAVYGMNHLFESRVLDKESIDALIVVTQTPDYFIPPTSFVIHGELGLRSDVMCMDIVQGCAGFVIGLMQAFMMLQQSNIKKVVLINVDVLSRKTSPLDRNSYPLIGDGCAITVIDNAHLGPIFANIHSDGSSRNALIIPAGGLRLPSNPTTSILEEDLEGNIRSKDHLVMNGSAVFNFVQTVVPTMIDDLLSFSNVEKSNVDYFAFHQPNRFMLEKLADKLGVPYSILPMDIVGKFGNASGVTIPTVLNSSLGFILQNEEKRVCLAGFGVGLTWGSILMNIGPLNSCQIIYKS